LGLSSLGYHRRVPAPIYVVPYDASWPARFDEERPALAHVLSPWLAGPIEHIGSTAVPGLVAKPVIDIMAAVASLDASRPALAAVAALHYVYFPYRTEIMHWLCKPSDEVRTHHLHLVPFGSALWQDRLRFRDRLRSDARVATEYAALKLALATRYEFDREAYTDAKEQFVRRILAENV
jgi:GrpB-like predicted nucleotidyltransferase (UPF0157 family)